jgi:hypothetical protein
MEFLGKEARVHHASRRRGELLLASAHLVLTFRNPAPPSSESIIDPELAD